MNFSMTANAAIPWRDYLGVCKLKVVALIVFTAMVGMFLSVPGMVPWSALIFGSLGIGMAAASAAAINHLVDRHIDARMTRTAARPVASGHLSGRNCLIFAVTLGLLAMWILVEFRHRRCSRRGSTGARLGGGHRPCRSECAAVVFDYLCLDAAAFLGTGDQPTQ
jgi:heme O synthase-like polyprenyltransferase